MGQTNRHNLNFNMSVNVQESYSCAFQRDKTIQEDKKLQHKKAFGNSAAAAAKSHQSCPTLCDPIDGSLPGSAVHEILQVRTLEWVAISFSNA